jgi:predicted glycogen debranching enzyme
MPLRFNPKAEWLEPDGLGGFASGTVGGIRSRRYHALLLSATTPPTGRYVLVNGFDAWIETPEGKFDLSSQKYTPDVISPDSINRIEEFEPLPWPRWKFLLEDGTRIDHELFTLNGSQSTCLSWKASGRGKTLCLRPFLSGRDYHSMHHQNLAFRFEAKIKAEKVRWKPYDSVPGTIAVSNGVFAENPAWYLNFLYSEEQSRGLDYVEDLASPGIFRWDLSVGEAVLILATEGKYASMLDSEESAVRACSKFRMLEKKRRSEFKTPLEQSGEAYLVQRGQGKTIVAGYPWFTDWGRDTFISMRGLCLATGRLEVARKILLEWAGIVSEGMLPNRFPDQGGTPEYNSVDASLWYIVAVFDYLQTAKLRGMPMRLEEVKTLRNSIESILNGYVQGTRYNIHLDSDGLSSSGQPGVQLTWMDAKVGDWVVTPRIGKPVEIQALWLNALWIAGQFDERWIPLFQRGREAFQLRFWNATRCCLYDVVDPDHKPGTVDSLIRPNQIFAVGGLPQQILQHEFAQKVVDAVEAKLLTPLGLRSLAPGEPGYTPHYQGGVRERDGGYHQGTVWPWLIGPFVEAWVRVRGSTAEAKKEAQTRFMQPLLQHLQNAGINHISEVADAEPPFTPGGCPFQAWSVGEALRLSLLILS